MVKIFILSTLYLGYKLTGVMVLLSMVEVHTAYFNEINFDSTKKEAALIGSLIQCLNFKRAFQFNDLVENKMISA